MESEATLDCRFFFGIIALASAAFWALGGILWRKVGDEIPPVSMNVGKALIGSLYLGIILVVVGLKPVDKQAFLLLAASGVIGIAIGDTFFFMSLMQLGPRLASLMGTLVPVSITIAAFIFLGERPSLWAWTGIFLTVGGVGWVLAERLPQNRIIKDKRLGIRYSLISIGCTATGVILAKVGVSAVPTVQATAIRLLGAGAGLVLWGCLTRRLKNWLIPFKNPRFLGRVSLIVFIVVFGGFWLSLLALKYIDASVAGALNSTSPVFILPMAALLLKEKVPVRAVLGAAIAVAGVALIL